MVGEQVSVLILVLMEDALRELQAVTVSGLMKKS